MPFGCSGFLFAAQEMVERSSSCLNQRSPASRPAVLRHCTTLTSDSPRDFCDPRRPQSLLPCTNAKPGYLFESLRRCSQTLPDLRQGRTPPVPWRTSPSPPLPRWSCKPGPSWRINGSRDRTEPLELPDAVRREQIPGDSQTPRPVRPDRTRPVLPDLRRYRGRIRTMPRLVDHAPPCRARADRAGWN
jgi:hypothetical protein